MERGNFTMKRGLSGRIGRAVLAVVFLLTHLCAGAVADTADLAYFDVIAGIDEASISVSDGAVSFTSADQNGNPVRFQLVGEGSVSAEGIRFGAGAYLVSLDRLGQIYSYAPTVSAADSADAWADFGAAYSYDGSDSVEEYGDLYTVLIGGIPAQDYKGGEYGEYSVADYLPNFLYFSGDPNYGFTMSSLVVGYDPDGAATPVDLPEQMQSSVPTTSETSAFDQYEHMDIVARIDMGSVQISGDKTCFSAVTPDGAVIRFEGNGVAVQENGMMFSPGATLTSLDSIGQICGYEYTIPENTGTEDTVEFGPAYTFSASKTSVNDASEVFKQANMVTRASTTEAGSGIISTEVYMPNFVHFAAPASNQREFLVSSLTIYYDPAVTTTGIRELALATEFYGSYLEGDPYKADCEESAKQNPLDFYLIALQDTPTADMKDNSSSIWMIESDFYTIGDLKDAGGNVLDKSTARVHAGDTLDVTISDYTLALELPVVERYAGAQTMHDLVPYAYPSALGEMNALVVPVIWADQPDMANDETLRLFREGVGRIVDESGAVTDYSDLTDEKFSLSEYYDIASYGKLSITSFMTDWYYADWTYEEYQQRSVEPEYADTILDWVKETYPDLDWSRYDQDGNGYVDALIILSAGTADDDTFYMGSYAYAINSRRSYAGDYAGTQDDPQVNTFVSIGYSFMANGDYSTLVHEFAHGLGLIDYYDVTYSGINAVGGYDMQSDNVGDWNAYSKYAVGWLEPQIVTGLASGETAEFTIGSLALKGDALVIPAANGDFDGPFDEYVLIDLLTDDGVNAYDAAAYDLDGVAGVRISHVNALMEKRTLEEASKLEGQEDSEPVSYDIGTVHFANDYTGDAFGRYNLEVIQSGGVNTFTKLDPNDPSSAESLRTKLCAEDLFYAGDTFSTEDYSEFFYSGLMDDGSKFGYTVEIVSVSTDENGEPTATIRVTAK